MRNIWCIGILVLLSGAASAQPLPQVAEGVVVRHANFSSVWVRPRHVDVWLPPGYNTNQRYAVLYMHDGQMLFDSAITWNKQEWGVDETMLQLLQAREIVPTIVVGVWNDGEYRHADYFPQAAMEGLPPAIQDSLYNSKRMSGASVFHGHRVQSDAYLRFLTTELKPFIDSMYSTLPGRQHTFVAGSSMGGLISMYAALKYPQVFGGAACLSTHWPGIFTMDHNPVPGAFWQMLRTHLGTAGSQRWYFDCGNQTLDAMYPPLQDQADALFIGKGYREPWYRSLRFPGTDHSEKAWRSRLHYPLQYLLGPPER